LSAVDLLDGAIAGHWHYARSSATTRSIRRIDWRQAFERAVGGFSRRLAAPAGSANVGTIRRPGGAG
jgi:hypothetical protein